MLQECLLVLVAFAVVVPQAGKTKPNFTGTWQANWSKSKLQFQQPDRTVFTVDHREPSFSLSRTHTFEGKSDTFSIRLTTDGKETVVKEEKRTVHARLTWAGDALVFDVKVEMADGSQSTDVVKYSVSPDGKTFTARERYRDAQHSYDNVWVFNRVK